MPTFPARVSRSWVFGFGLDSGHYLNMREGGERRMFEVAWTACCVLPGRRVVGMRGRGTWDLPGSLWEWPQSRPETSRVFLPALQMGEFPVEREAGEVGNAP